MCPDVPRHTADPTTVNIPRGAPREKPAIQGPAPTHTAGSPDPEHAAKLAADLANAGQPTDLAIDPDAVKHTADPDPELAARIEAGLRNGASNGSGPSVTPNPTPAPEPAQAQSAQWGASQLHPEVEQLLGDASTMMAMHQTAKRQQRVMIVCLLLAAGAIGYAIIVSRPEQTETATL